MSYALHFECIRCGDLYPFQPMFYGCPSCYETHFCRCCQQCVSIAEDDLGVRCLAMCANDDEMLAAQMDLPTTEGIYVEASAALSLAVVKKMRKRGQIAGDDVVVILSTSGGLKDPGVTTRMLPDIPIIEPSEEALRDALQRVYDTELQTQGAPQAED